MGPEGFWLFGERGLAEVDLPVMIIAGTADVTTPYYHEAAQILGALSSPDKTMVSFVGKTHFMVEEPEVMKRINHFVTAFFGYYLQGQEEYLEFISADYVTQFEDLAWGVYEGD
jgi:predicted dienelactone hydrolase